MSTFWAEDISQLVALNKGLIPASNKTIIENLNATSRLALLACILIALFEPVLAVGVFCIVTVIVFAIYYGIQQKKESFVETTNHVFRPSLSCPPTERLRAEDIKIQFDEEYLSQNQMLVGGPNPKTFIPPIIAPPSHELSEWKASDLTIHSGINSETNFDIASSGYSMGPEHVSKYFGYTVPIHRQEMPKICSECLLAPCRCKVTKSDQLLTSTLQPGIYRRSDFLEPINSLIGISQQKQFDTRYTSTANHKLSSQYQIKTDTLPDVTFLQSESDVFDPRFTGYGPTDRGYIDPVTGAGKFFYDDINAVTMPNYICRNNVDIYPWAAQYGSGINGSLSTGIAEGDGYKQLAENAFTDSSIKFRTEMQERLMRKRNAELWQQRAAPIRTM